MPSSAQWMSSKTMTSGRSVAIASISARIAAKKLSRSRCGSSSSAEAASCGEPMPSRRAIVAACRLASPGAPSPFRRCSAPSVSLCQAISALSPSSISNSWRSTSPSAQYTTADP